jgi:ornithine decarboxylase
MVYMEKNTSKNEKTILAKTPYLEIRLDKIRDAYARMSKYLTGIEIHYAMKCNPNHEIMKTILDCGGQFEISSADEMRKAIAAGADPKNILFSNPIKTLSDIKAAYKAGVQYFSFDSYSEVDKLAEGAPGSKVYVRISIPVRKSVVASEGKFGVSIDQAKDLMLYAKKMGLEPYGISFHVGSQMLDYESWSYAIQHSSKLMNMLKKSHIQIEMLDMGGGFPACYKDVKRDNLDRIANKILKALKKYIPAGVRVVAEPGRYLVADSGIMTSTVIGTAERFGRKWLHLDVGANNGLMEAVQTGNALEYPVSDSKKSEEKDIFVLTGPTCDSQDTIMFDVPVSADIQIGDKIYFECAGAYTTAMSENFNGFPSPKTYITDKRA